MDEERKTVKDYLLKYGINGKYFIDSENSLLYEVIDIVQGSFKEDTRSLAYLNVKHFSARGEEYLVLGTHLGNAEATSEEVQRAKEGKLVEITAKNP